MTDDATIGPDPLNAMIKAREALLIRYASEREAINVRAAAERDALFQSFVAELTRLDIDIGELQRHNLTKTTFATIVAGYRTLRDDIDALVDGGERDIEGLRALIQAQTERINAIQADVTGLQEREAGRGV